MNSKDNQLKKELLQAGAEPNEAESLEAIARALHGLKDQEPTFPRNTQIPFKTIGDRRRGVLAASLTATGLAVGLIVGAIAQTTYPGATLYPVKELTENIAVAIQPGYRGTVMMHRAQEVKQLVAHRLSPNLVTTALENYKTEAASYKGGNYADFEYCENTLSQAEAMSSGAERLAIAQTITSVKAETPASSN